MILDNKIHPFFTYGVVEFVVVKLGKFRDGSDRGGKVGTEIGGRPFKAISSNTK